MLLNSIEDFWKAFGPAKFEMSGKRLHPQHLLLTADLTLLKKGLL